MKAVISELRNSVSMQQNNMSQKSVPVESNLPNGEPVLGFNIHARGMGMGRRGRGGRVIVGYTPMIPQHIVPGLLSHATKKRKGRRCS